MTSKLNLDTLRRFIRQAFDSGALSNFCRDYFYAVYTTWPNGLAYDDLITRLLAHSQQTSTHAEELLSAIFEAYEFSDPLQPKLVTLAQNLERLLLQHCRLTSTLNLSMAHDSDGFAELRQRLNTRFGQVESVRFFCYDTPVFLPLYNHWRPGTTKKVMISQLVSYAQEMGQLEKLGYTNVAPAKLEVKPLTKLTGKQFASLEKAMLSAFPNIPDLSRMVRFGLDENLNTIASGGNLGDIIFNLITWAESQGRLMELVRAACETNSGNIELKAWAEQWILAK